MKKSIPSLNRQGMVPFRYRRRHSCGNSVVSNKSLVLDKYALDYGIGLFRYSYGTAIGIFKSVVSIILLLFVNTVAKQVGEERLI